MEVKPVSNHHKVRNVIRFAVTTTLLAAVFFALTDPSQGGAVLIMFGSALLSAVIYSWSILLVMLFAGQKVHGIQGAPRLALLVAAPVAYVILMQSIGQLNIEDVLAVVPLVAVLYFYLVRSAVSRT